MVLGPGTAWIPLTYWGLMLRDTRRQRPLRARDRVALSTTGEMPNQKNDVVRERPRHEAVRRRDSFSDRAFNDPDLLDAGRPRSRPMQPPGGGELQAEPARRRCAGHRVDCAARARADC